MECSFVKAAAAAVVVIFNIQNNTLVRVHPLTQWIVVALEEANPIERPDTVNE